MNTKIIALLLLSQSFVSCQQSPEKVRPSAAKLIFQSRDGGQTWEDVSAGLPDTIRVNCLYAEADKIMLGHNHGLYHSSTASEIPNWKQDILLDERITDFFSGRNGLYACSAGKGFFQEITGTGIWRPMLTSLKDKEVRTVLEAPDGSIFVGSNNGIYKSIDDGKTWNQIFHDVIVTSLVMSDGVIIAGTSRGLIRSTDGGEHWEWTLSEDNSIKKTGLIDGYFVAISNGAGSWNEIVANPELLSGKMRISPDQGKSWQRLDKNLSMVRFIYARDENSSPFRVINDIAQVGNYLLCSLDNGIYRSNDLGKSWNLVLQSNGRMWFEMAVSGQMIYAVLVFEGC